MITANPLSAVAVMLQQDSPLETDHVGFKRNVLPQLGKASVVLDLPFIRGVSASLACRDATMTGVLMFKRM